MTPAAFRPSPGVVYTPLKDGTAALIHIPSMTYFSLNGTGRAVWDGIAAGASSESIADHLAAVHDLTLEEARSTVRGFLEDLVAEGLIIRNNRV